MKKLLLAFSLLLFTTMTYATPFTLPGKNGDVSQAQDVNIEQTIYVTAPAGADGADGTDGVSYYGNDSYDEKAIDSLAAQFSAISNIPGLNHRGGEHAHTGVGVGVGMSGDEVAGAIGFMHHYEENVVVKVSAAFSRAFRNTVGVGASYSW